MDRYTVNGRLRQVMLSSRQINASKLPVQNWVSTHLKYTHGYGLCMSPVNEIVGGKRGMPNYWVGDIPPVGEYGLKVTRPGIYYGASVHPRMIERIQQPETPLETARPSLPVAVQLTSLRPPVMYWSTMVVTSSPLILKMSSFT